MGDKEHPSGGNIFKIEELEAPFDELDALLPSGPTDIEGVQRVIGHLHLLIDPFDRWHAWNHAAERILDIIGSMPQELVELGDETLQQLPPGDYANTFYDVIQGEADS